MLKLSKKADYALIIITYLAKNPDEYISIRQISDNTNVPYKFASQIATQLKKSGLILSKEGIDGGYQLSRTPQEINIRQVVEAVEGPLAPTACMRGKDCNCQASCHHRELISNLSDSLTQILQSQTIASLL